MVMIKVRPGENGTLIVELPYNQDAIAKIKTITGRVWNAEQRAWRIPSQPDTLKQLRLLFVSDTLVVDPSLYPAISEVTRRDIIDYLITMKSPFHGRLSITNFLSRVWDLSAIPSTDSRYKTASSDIWQHMENNYDWDEHYLFYDYLKMLDAPIETFLKLIEQVVHPIVNPDEEQVLEMVHAFNDYLEPDGYKLIVEREVSGRPIYKAVYLDATDQAANTPFDVVLSFAGEERPFVERVANYLSTHGAKVFYDQHEIVTMWGKDLAEHLDAIYGGDAKFCVMFISENYAKKMWTIHERRSAVAKALSETKEYILPVRFDGTKLPGIPSTMGYVDATGRSPEDVARLIMAKLGQLRNKSD